MIRPTASGRIAPIPPIVPIHSDTSNFYLHLFTGEIRPIPSFLEYPRGCFLFSTWASKNSSEVSFDSSEVSFHSSEVLFRVHVENFIFPRGYFETSTWKSLFPDTALFRCVVGSKMLLRSGALFA